MERSRTDVRPVNRLVMSTELNCNYYVFKPKKYLCNFVVAQETVLHNVLCTTDVMCVSVRKGNI